MPIVPDGLTLIFRSNERNQKGQPHGPPSDFFLPSYRSLLLAVPRGLHCNSLGRDGEGTGTHNFTGRAVVEIAS
jgi:hypothetical protein